MITVKLQGGLGNQCFQAAMGYAQAKRLGVQLQFDISLLRGGRRKYQLDQWHRFCPVSRPPEEHEFQVLPETTRTGTTINENGMPYNQGLVDLVRKDAVLNGYWQTEKYFNHIGNEIRGLFYPRAIGAPTRTQADLEFLLWREQIGEKESVMVHIRRGDYLVEPYKSFHGVLPLSYYKTAMDYIRRNAATSPRFFVFSDDPVWARENILGTDITIVGVEREAHAIYLMSLCKHSIIANSSFSWWGAWLGYGKENGIHIAPKQWFAKSKEDIRDLIPEAWETIDVVQPVTKTQSSPKVLIAVNSWDIAAKRGCHQAIRETWGKHVAPADLRFFVPDVSDHKLLADEVFLNVPRDYDSVCHEVVEILRWSLNEGYDFTFLVSTDVFMLPQKLLQSGFEHYDYSGFFHEQMPVGPGTTTPYKCNFNTADGIGIERNLHNWADGGDGRMLSRKAAQAVVDQGHLANYWFAADDIMIGQILSPNADITTWNFAYHKDADPDNGMTWHFKNYPAHKGITYDPKDGWLQKMYKEHK